MTYIYMQTTFCCHSKCSTRKKFGPNGKPSPRYLWSRGWTTAAASVASHEPFEGCSNNVSSKRLQNGWQARLAKCGHKLIPIWQVYCATIVSGLGVYIYIYIVYNHLRACHDWSVNHQHVLRVKYKYERSLINADDHPILRRSTPQEVCLVCWFWAPVL